MISSKKKYYKKKYCTFCKYYGHTSGNCYFYEQKMLDNLIVWCKTYPNIEEDRVITQRIFVKKEDKLKNE